MSSKCKRKVTTTHVKGILYVYNKSTSKWVDLVNRRLRRWLRGDIWCPSKRASGNLSKSQMEEIERKIKTCFVPSLVQMHDEGREWKCLQPGNASAFEHIQIRPTVGLGGKGKKSGKMWQCGMKGRWKRTAE